MAIAYSKKDIFQRTKTVYLFKMTYYFVQTIHFSAPYLLRINVCCKEGYFPQRNTQALGTWVLDTLALSPTLTPPCPPPIFLCQVVLLSSYLLLSWLIICINLQQICKIKNF